jgi:hypothetical protein
VKKCFFFDFFGKNKASYLTSLFCNAEQKILKGALSDIELMVTTGIKPVTHNLRFDLKGKLSDGNRLCKFQFRKMDLLKDYDLSVDKLA